MPPGEMRVYRGSNPSGRETMKHRLPSALRRRFGPRAARGAGRARRRPFRRRPPKQPAPASGLETAVLAGGCFWGMQAVFQHVKGVTNAVSGYAGGAQKDADYETVSSGAPATPKRAGDLRPAPDVLRQDPADLFLGRAQPDPAQPPGPGPRHAISLGDFPAKRRAARRSPRPTSRSSTPRMCSRRRS